MIEFIYKHYLGSFHATIDSRTVKHGSIFFALKGESNDGNAFASKALQNGAALAIIDNPAYMTEGCVLVENSLKTLQQLANYHRKNLKIKAFALTGSNGKTTTKELLFAVLSKKFRVKATTGNLNNHLGVPLTLLSLTPDLEYAIVEMGANHPGDIDELCRIADPNFGLITNIGKAHLGGFGGFQGVIKTKGELYEYLISKNGTIFYNSQNPILTDLLMKHGAISAIPYSKYIDVFSTLDNEQNPFLRVSLSEGQTTTTIQTNLVGSYNLENVMAAYTVGRYFGIEHGIIKEAIEGYVPSNNRSQLIKTPKNTIIMDAYNANPTSMENALRNLASLKVDNKVAILGEMLELGEYSEEEHQRIVKLALSLNFSKVIFVGCGFANHMGNLEYFTNAKACTEFLRKKPITNATILVKGSRGVMLEQVLEVL